MHARILFFVAVLVAQSTTRCPRSHPFAFSRHKRHCCRTKRELSFLVQLRCDHSLLHSRNGVNDCCDNDDHVPCPKKFGPCADYDLEAQIERTVACSYHMGMSYYRNFLRGYQPTKSDSAEQCCAACAKNHKCFAWTWRHESHFCYLQSERALQTPLRHDARSTSGTRLVIEPPGLAVPDVPGVLTVLGVSCGDSRAATCSECSQGDGVLPCTGDCNWVRDRCITRDCACDNKDVPVCGANGLTYDNACVATCAGVSMVPGECDVEAVTESLPKNATGTACACTGESEPVCANEQTYTNMCEAACDGVEPSSVTQGKCAHCVCLSLYDPVCGADGHTYSNACTAECNNVQEHVPGECPDKCACQEIFRPVCANGTTYENACEAECDKVAYTEGACCACGTAADPVCGVDGVTYRNACEAGCAGVDYRLHTCESYAQHVGLFLGTGLCAWDGSPFSDDRAIMTASLSECEAECQGNLGCTGYSIAAERRSHVWNRCTLYMNMPVNDVLPKPRLRNWCYTLGRNCTCLSTVDPVCGENGVTYDNPCKSRCAKEYFTKGTCASHIPEDSRCVCQEIWKPVCGSDHTTYANECEANCAKIYDVTPGSCDADCICTALWQPVCGTDGQTYENSCRASCAGILSFTEGECAEDPSDTPVDDVDCICITLWQPVCGSDGQTYENSCRANCAGISSFTEGECAEEQLCEVHVPRHGTMPCVFPFSVDGVAYEGCIGNPAWCLASDDELYLWGFCPDSCPMAVDMRAPQVETDDPLSDVLL